MPVSPFGLRENSAYQFWRAQKLATAPTELEELIIEVRDPRRLTTTERAGILERCRRANMALYAGTTGDDPDKSIPAGLGEQFGLSRLDHNRGADQDAITSLKVQADAGHRDYIPYSNRPIAWHTDGYYNAPECQIHGLILHCVHPAKHGGENALLDHELVYIQVRDHNPDYVRALMHPACMTIPANHVNASEVRPDQPGPVFSIRPDGHLHMRYTHRERSILWRDDPLTSEAVAYLKQVLTDTSPWHFVGRLESGWGLICNNVLHTRTGFSDGTIPRLIYRARYYDRVQ
jgi:hypothetical protein